MSLSLFILYRFRLKATFKLFSTTNRNSKTRTARLMQIHYFCTLVVVKQSVLQCWINVKRYLLLFVHDHRISASHMSLINYPVMNEYISDGGGQTGRSVTLRPESFWTASAADVVSSLKKQVKSKLFTLQCTAFISTNVWFH